MKKSFFHVLPAVFLVAVFAVFSSGAASAAPDKGAAGKAVVKAGKMQKSSKVAPREAALKEKAEGRQEAPNMTSRTDQASDSGDAAAKKKLIDLEDTPNPMESQVKTNAGRAMGVEAGTKGPGVDPVNPATAKANNASSKVRELDPCARSQVKDAVNPKQKAGMVK